ncbi:ABC transporter substrate-binding protein [Rhodoligotrophos ferricapiens]|uniref:ABC transporter substrate-binding protein n=1 Tax=Rhodoligotrophos ferricapiens TaxID=3069264 RepID=UPI00315D8855
MFSRRSVLSLSAASTAALLLPKNLYAQGSAPAVGKPGGSLTAAIFADPLSLDPHLTGNLQGRAATRAIHDTLFTIQDGRLAPGLVESWEQPDEKTFVLKLRQGIKFHDGTPFDAEAVKFNIDRIRDTSIGSIRGGEITALDTIEAVDAHTVKMVTKYPFAAFLFPFTDVTGCIGSPAAFKKHGIDYGLHPSGTGPFKLAEYSKDNRTVLEKNGGYWQKGKPYLDQVILRPVPTDSTRLSELRAGSVQIAEALPLQDIQRLRAANEFVVSEKPGFRWEYFGFNLRDQYPGKSKAFRQAFQWAIDRQALHQVAYFGTGEIGYDGILPGSPFYDPNYKPFKRDVDKAKRLIEESGLDTPILIGAPLQPDPVKQRATQIFQANAAEIGVKVNIEQIDSAGYRNMLRDGMMPMDAQGWWGYRPDPDQYLAILLGSEGSYAKYHAYSNPEMDKLIQAERAGRTEEERRIAFRKISELMNEDAVYVPWHYSSDFKGLDPKVKGFQHAADGIINFAELWIEA